VFRFDKQLGDDYYAFRRGDENRLEERLEALEVGRSDFVDIAYVPWVIRARDMLGLELPEQLETWLAHVSKRPSFAAEREIVAGLAAV
jgi:glutathione S-transferase